MFKVQRDRVFKAVVDVSIPSPDAAGETVTGQFTATFRALSRSDFEQMKDSKLTDREFLSKVIVGVEGLCDADGTPYPAKDALELIVEDITLSAAAVQRFLKEYVKERAGN